MPSVSLFAQCNIILNIFLRLEATSKYYSVRPSFIKLSYRVFIKYCVFPKILKYAELWPFSVFPRCQCVYTHQAGRKPALQTELAEFRKITTFFGEKHNI